LPDISALNGTAIDSVAEFDGLTVTAAVAFTGLLDTYTGAAAGYSTRRLASSATVLMRVRRETAGGTGDDDEADVAYDSNNELSLDSAISNASAGVTATTLGQFLNVGTVNGTTYTNPDSLTVTASCFVDEWKDQSGNANHAEQTAQGDQPQIHSGTVNTDLILENGKPAVEFASDYIVAPAFSTAVSQPNTYFITVNKTNHSGYLFERSGSGERQAQGNSTWVFAGSVANGFYPTADLANQRLFTLLFNGASSISRMNSVATGSGNPGTLGQGGIQIGRPVQSLTGKVQEFIMYGADQTSNFTGIEENINSEFLIYQPTDAPTSGLLATYTGAAAAYSVRQLSDKAVIALRVRRDSDDEETNIGWDANGDLDTTAISDFCQTANGYVTRWWDQSTNGNHADQATDASQPQIYNGTAVITENGKPVLDFDGNDDYLDWTTTSTISQPFTVFTVNPLQTNGFVMDSSSTNSGFRCVLGDFGGAGYGMFAPTWIRASITPTTQSLNTAIYNTTTSALYIDGSSHVTGNVGTNGLTDSAGFVRIGNRAPSTGVGINSMQEFILYNSNQTSNRTGIESNIDTYFQIP